MRRRLYLMRHGAVSYFDADGQLNRPDEVGLNEDGKRQATTAAAVLAGIAFDRVVASSLPRAIETARIVAPGGEVEEWPELRELKGAPLEALPEDEIEAVFTGAFTGAVALDKTFLLGETIGELLDRVVPALERLVADTTWDTVLAVLHGGVNRAILSYALSGERCFYGGFEQAPGCINVLDVGPNGWVVRAVNYAPEDALHTRTRLTTMEELFTQYQPRSADRASDRRAR